MIIYKKQLIAIVIILQSFTFLVTKFATIYKDFFIVLLGIVFFIYILRAYFWQKILIHNRLSDVYPFNSLVNILILIYSVFIFNETVDVYNILGVCLMIYGLFMMSTKNG